MKKPNCKTVLILTGPMGSGHIRAALAVKEALELNYPNDRILYVDTTSWMDPFIRWIFLGLYPFLLAHLPTVWRLIHNSNDSKGKGLFTFLFNLFDIGIKRKIRKTVKRNHVNLIICTHFYPGYITDKMKKEGILSIPVTSVVTDHGAHHLYACENHDLIFVPNQEAVEQMQKWGIQKERMIVSRCPVFAKFSHEHSEEELKKYREELDLKPGIMYIMLTMGGWAVGDMCSIAKRVLATDKEFGLIVMTAYNQKLFRKLALMALEDDRILPVSFTDQMDKYMAVSSFVVTKPGGITTSECLAMRKPMLLVDPIAGHEEKNLEYLVNKGYALAPYADDTPGTVACRMKECSAELMAKMSEYSVTAAKASSVIADESMKLVAGKAK